MLIISKFHDYYDSAIGMGIDKPVVYERHTDETNWQQHTHKDHSYVGQKVGRGATLWRIDLLCREIGFCGKWYRCVRAEISPYDWRAKVAPSVFWDAESFAEFLRNVNIQDMDKPTARWRNEKVYLPLQGAEGRKQYFAPYEEEALFLKHKMPVFLRALQEENPTPFRTPGGYVINPGLAEWQFQKVKDPFAAFQDIFMYISGVLGVNTREIITLKDVDKIHKHGFDGLSFRNAKVPEGKKKRPRGP